MSSRALKTSAGAMVFLPALMVFSLALQQDVSCRVQTSLERMDVLGGQIVDEYCGALTQGQDGIGLNLRVGRKNALGQAGYYRFGKCQVLSQS